MSKNWIAFKGIVSAGLIAWLSDKRSLRNRLVFLPFALPFFFLAMFAMVALAVHMRDAETTDTKGNTVKGTIAAIAESPYSKQIEDALSDKYKVIVVSADSLESTVKDRKATFGLRLDSVTESEYRLTLIYDLNRNYVHKQWIRSIRGSTSDIKAEIIRTELEKMDLPPLVHKVMESKLSFESVGFGSAGGVSLVLGIMILLWNVLIIAPIDYAKTTLYRLFVEDITHDLLPSWKAAKLSSNVLLWGRIASALIVYSITAIVMMAHVLLWCWVYTNLVEFVLSQPNQQFTSDHSAKMLTVGFLDFISTQNLSGIFALIASSILVAMLILTYFTPGTLKSIDSEQARNKNKLFDFALLNIPLIGFIIGYTAPSYILAVLPIYNLYHFSTVTLSGDLTLGFASSFVISNLIFVALISFRAKSLMDDDSRYLLRN